MVDFPFRMRHGGPPRITPRAAKRLSAKCTLRHLRIKMKELMAPRGPAEIFQDREGVAAGGFGSYRLCQRHRPLFMAGPDEK
jgi:hypothetical protein